MYRSPARSPRASLLVRGLGLAAVVLATALAAPARAGATDDGKRLLGEKRYDQAAAAYRKALKASPSDHDALIGLAKAASQGRLGVEAYQEAEGLLRDRLKAKADDRPARLMLAEVYLAWVPEDNRYRADAQDQFQKLAQSDPTDADAVVGLARVYWIAGDTPHALEILDGFLAKTPASATAQFGKGEILYTDAKNTYESTKTFSTDVRDLFARAAGAYEAATKADPKRRDAWLWLAYASQWVAGGDEARTATAADAYEKAFALDLDDPAPLRGLGALLAKKPEVLSATLDRIAKAYPKSPALLLAQADRAKEAGKYDEAEAAYRASLAATKNPAAVWASLGALLEKKGDAEGAKKAYMKSVELDPDSATGVTLGNTLLGALDSQAEAAFDSSVKAHKLLDEYKALAAIMPNNKNVRNDGGFFCREAYAKSGKTDAALLKGSVDLYVAASALIPEYRDEFEQSVPYEERHINAQILNDTGLMFQYEPPIRDYKKAEAYYRRAMEWTQFGYWDAFGNLIKILKEQQRWKDAYDFAAACAEGIKMNTGAPNETQRATCAAVRDSLQAKLGKDGDKDAGMDGGMEGGTDAPKDPPKDPYGK